SQISKTSPDSHPQTNTDSTHHNAHHARNQNPADKSTAHHATANQSQAQHNRPAPVRRQSNRQAHDSSSARAQTKPPAQTSTHQPVLATSAKNSPDVLPA